MARAGDMHGARATHRLERRRRKQGLATMTLKGRVARLEGSASGMSESLFKRSIICSVRLQSIEEDMRAAFAAAGLEISNGDIIRQIICEWPGQHHVAFVSEFLDVHR